MTTDVIRKIAIECGAVESPYSTALILDNFNLELYTEKIIEHLTNNIKDFCNYAVNQRPRSSSNTQTYLEAVEHIMIHLKSENLND